MSELCKRINDITNKISPVKLVAVTKTLSADVVKEAILCGAKYIGENRVQEAARKIELLGKGNVQWHLIGHLQKNKAKYAVKLFDLIHSVDSIALAKEISKQAEKINKVQDILIEVNVAGEESKFGVKPEELEFMYLGIRELPNINIRGLMTVAPISETGADVKWVFQRLRGLLNLLNEKFEAGLTELSMGMSDDYETAIKEGATMIRLGRALFGERNV